MIFSLLKSGSRGSSTGEAEGPPTPGRYPVGLGSHFSIRTLGRRETWRASTTVLAGELQLGPRGIEGGSLEVEVAQLGGGGREGDSLRHLARVLETRRLPRLRLDLLGGSRVGTAEAELDLHGIRRTLWVPFRLSTLGPGVRRAFLHAEVQAANWGVCLPRAKDGSPERSEGADLSLVFDLRLPEKAALGPAPTPPPRRA